jgi:hypothetical protein
MLTLISLGMICLKKLLMKFLTLMVNTHLTTYKNNCYPIKALMVHVCHQAVPSIIITRILIGHYTQIRIDRRLKVSIIHFLQIIALNR